MVEYRELTLGAMLGRVLRAFSETDGVAWGTAADVSENTEDAGRFGGERSESRREVVPGAVGCGEAAPGRLTRLSRRLAR